MRNFAVSMVKLGHETEKSNDMFLREHVPRDLLNMSRKIAKKYSVGSNFNLKKKTSAILDFLKNATILERADKIKRGVRHNLSFLFHIVHQP